MSKLLKQPSEVDWDQFFYAGYLLEDRATNTIWGGYGQSDSGALSFFYTKFFEKRRVSFGQEFVFCLETKVFWKEMVKRCLNDLELTPKGSIDEDFLNCAHNIIDAIKHKEMKKVVPVTFKEYSFQGRPELSLLKFKNLEGHLYGFWDKSGGVLGVSPEVLFYRSKKQDQFVALAGTIESSILDAKQALLDSSKDRHEHDLVIKDICNKLNRIGLKEVSIGETYTIEYGPLIHLKTEITTPKSERRIEDLIDALHPTAALCGFPERVAFELLKKQPHYQLEKEERLFGGVFGIETQDFSLAIVMIRNIQWKKDKLYIHSGCGLVDTSEPDKELEEVQNKRKAIESLYIKEGH